MFSEEDPCPATGQACRTSGPAHLFSGQLEAGPTSGKFSLMHSARAQAEGREAEAKGQVSWNVGGLLVEPVVGVCLHL